MKTKSLDECSIFPYAKYFCIILIFKKRKSYINVQAQYKLVQIKTNLELDKKNLACFTKACCKRTAGSQFGKSCFTKPLEGFFCRCSRLESWLNNFYSNSEAYIIIVLYPIAYFSLPWYSSNFNCERKKERSRCNMYMFIDFNPTFHSVLYYRQIVHSSTIMI